MRNLGVVLTVVMFGCGVPTGPSDVPAPVGVAEAAGEVRASALCDRDKGCASLVCPVDADVCPCPPRISGGITFGAWSACTFDANGRYTRTRTVTVTETYYSACTGEKLYSTGSTTYEVQSCTSDGRG